MKKIVNFKISLIIPTYNEKECLEKLLMKINSLNIPDLEVIVVDDNSPDGTGKLAEDLSKKYPLTIIHRQKKMGIGSAYQVGFHYILQHRADLIFQMDADLSHDPREIPNFIEEIKKGMDMVIGSRRLPGGKIIGWNFWRHFCSWGAMKLTRFLLNLKTKDVTSGYRCYTRKALETLNVFKLKSNGYAFFEEITFLAEKGGTKIKEIPITFLDRQNGHSKLNGKEVFDFFKTLWRLKFTKSKN